MSTSAGRRDDPGGATLTDEALVTAARARDNHALEHLLDRHYLLIHRYLTWLSHDPDLADDLTQDTLLLAASRIGQLSDGTAFRPWLYAIARNRFLDSRRNRRQTLSLDRLMERTGGDCSLAVRSPSIEQWAESELIQQVFSRLSVEMREALYLRYVAGYVVADVAVILDIAPMAVYQRLHRARQAFRNHYAALNHEPTYDGVPREANGTI